MNNTAAKTNSKFTIQQIAMIAVMTAVTCVLAPLSIPMVRCRFHLPTLLFIFHCSFWERKKEPSAT